jgi:predicted ATPase/transcriptional regulator with XRE-family HTH domain
MKARRKMLDLTQAALARQVGCAAVTIKQFESGQRRPSRQVAELLATSLDIPADERDTFIRAARAPQMNAPLPDAPVDLPAEDGVARSPLPFPVTPLIGRGHELARLEARLLRSDVRLLTLIGPPGAGKTRLGIQLAASVGNAFADGVVFVPLAPVREADQVLAAIGRALGVQQGGHELFARLQRSVRDCQLLLVLDNFEHVLAAAPLIGELLNAASRLKLLATSRTPLRVYGEHEIAVSPLALPPLDPLPALPELGCCPAVELFVARAQAVNAEFTLDSTNAHAVAQLCHRLDGLPLAIELAAGRIRLLTPKMLMERMQNQLRVLTGGAQDLPTRQQTLWNAIDWSYTLLSEVERAVLRQLAVFAGDWTLEAAEAIVEGAAQPLFESLSMLVSQSLVVTEVHEGVARYHLLESIREYALERLRECHEEDGARSRHATYYLSLVKTLYWTP